MRNTVPTAYTAVPTGVTVASGHVRRNQRSRCRNPSGHVHRNVGHDPGITGHVGPEYSEAAAVARKFDFSRQVGSSLVVREPIGVVGCITPWNYPLHQISAKVAFAMAAGCSVVLKPSEVAPLDAFMLTEIIEEACLPAGVFNLVTGTGPVVGEAIAAHLGVDMVSFTGSTRAGRRVSQLAAETIKKVSLELGGKSANVICDDLDEAAFAKAVAAGVSKAFLNSGQT